MNTNMLATAATLSDVALLQRLEALAGRAREATAELIAHLSELQIRKAHRGEGPGSLFEYCTRILRLSQAAAFNRIAAASAARRFPMILDLLADGSINLTTVRVLAPHLTAENHRAALHDAIGRTKDEVKEIVARIDPQPDVPPSIRKVAAPAPRLAATATPSAPSLNLAPSSEPNRTASRGTPPVVQTSSPAHPPAVAPLAPERYRVQFTVGKETHEKLRRVQDLLRRDVPDGDLGAIFDRALTLLLTEVERKTFAATTRPRPGRSVKPGSRTIPAHVKRAVWKRDGGQCAFAARSGRRCAATTFLEFHHLEPHACGGEATVDNIALHCRTHNVYESELIFGRFDPSAVRETAATYGADAERPWKTCPGTGSDEDVAPARIVTLAVTMGP